MNDHALAAAFVLGAWWLSTGVILGLVWQRAASFRWSLAGGSLLGLAGLGGLAWSSRLTTEAAPYLAFCSGLLVWGWHELTFLLGVVTGPRRVIATPGLRGWPRFVEATLTVWHHELVLAGTAALVVALCWGAPTQAGVATYLVLWVLRLSAKLNVFLGVRHFNDEFVPEHLRYLNSYFRRSGPTWLLPASILCAAGLAGVLLAGAFGAADGSTSRTMVGMLLALGALEHVFLAVKVPDAALWRWVIRRPTAAQLIDERARP